MGASDKRMLRLAVQNCVDLISCLEQRERLQQAKTDPSIHAPKKFHFHPLEFPCIRNRTHMHAHKNLRDEKKGGKGNVEQIRAADCLCRAAPKTRCPYKMAAFNKLRTSISFLFRQGDGGMKVKKRKGRGEFRDVVQPVPAQ